MIQFTVSQSHVGLLYEDGVYTRTLPPGLHEIGRRYFERKRYEIETVATCASVR